VLFNNTWWRAWAAYALVEYSIGLVINPFHTVPLMACFPGKIVSHAMCFSNPSRFNNSSFKMERI
jgi:hypothetical protein